jgi:hypothetical protein
MIPFTTGGVSRPAPEMEVSLTPASENGYCTLQLNIFSEDANNVRIAFYPLGNINIWCKNSTPAKIVNSDWYASALSADQVTAIKSTGLTITYEDLFPDVEYAAIVSVKNDELTETIKTVSVKTPIKPVPTRVESDLFTSLLGEWEVSYPLIQFNKMNVKILNAKVTIAAGADNETADHYRSYNRLVIQGWPFNVEADGTHNPMPYYSPADLKEFGSLYRDYSGLALRDYGPKIFLEIGEGDVISVPSARGEYEITTVNQQFLADGELKVQTLGRGFAWLDTGTHDSLSEASTYIEVLEKRQGLKVACLEGIAYRQGWISEERMRELAQPMLKNQYGQYLLRVIDEVKQTGKPNLE